MSDLAVIILVGNEELHIKRCLDKLAPLEPRQIFVVESQNGDRTHEIVEEWAESVSPVLTSVVSVWHDWPGNQAKQFNWAIDNLPIEADWILRLDADEYLTTASIEWLKENLAEIDDRIEVLEFILQRKFMGREIRYGTNGIPMVRMFRKGCGRYLETKMDERLVFDGEKSASPVVFYDDNLNTLKWWKEKHQGYAKREALQAIEGSFQDPRKAKYYRLPPYFRAFAYFSYRYFIRLGFLDGYAGWMWHFWQGLWYRCLVDFEIGRLKNQCRA